MIKADRPVSLVKAAYLIVAQAPSYKTVRNNKPLPIFYCACTQ